MPNYRYNMPEYERRNSCGSHPQAAAHRHRQPNCNTANEPFVNPQGSCEAARNSCEVPIRDFCETAGNSCEIPRRDCREPEKISCAVEDNYDTLAGMPLAMAYVPWQMWHGIYDCEKAFCQGTIFKELDKPFYGVGGAC